MASFVSGGGGGGSKEKFIVALTSSSGGTYTVNKTINEIKDAYTDGKEVIMKYNEQILYLTGVYRDIYASFGTLQTGNTSMAVLLNPSDTEGGDAVGEVDVVFFNPTHLSGTTSNVQTQLNSKASSSSLSNYMQKGTDYVTAGQKSGTTLGTKATAEGESTTARGEDSHAEGFETTASGEDSHAEGKETTASGNYSHSEGNGTEASALGSHAEGEGSIASGQYSHAEGSGTQATGDYAHAEGEDTVANGKFSHAEGSGSGASEQCSHAEGYYSGASGRYSHAEGNYTIAQRKSQHVFGEYNVADTTGSVTTRGAYVEIVGNGTAQTRSNARTLDWSGNEVLAGKLTVGTAPTNNMDVATKKYVDDSIPTVPAQVSKLYTATCPTAAATTAKVATLDDSTGFSLTAGVRVAVTFTYGNTATTPTLNVSSSGAKTIAINSSATAFTTGNGTTYNTWGAYETVIFTYTGTYWVHEPSGYQTYLLAPKASPAFTGTPTAPTATAGTNTTQIATTAFVQTALGNKLTYGNTDLTAGTSTLAEGVFYAYYE